MEQNQLLKVCEVQLTYKPSFNPVDRPQITTSKQCYSIIMQHWNLGLINFLEEFKIILLNRSNRVLGLVDISMGGVSGTYVDPKVIFVVALKANASGLIMCHNHPSGNLRPSDADFKLTSKLKECAKLLEIEIHDHLIISGNGYYSMADDGII
ncbi:JAB domain-containing protein [Pedobacter sp. HDW13]|uniref:JAB domain-containing protein n=1 Tax=Pedobacter sp. HDW13 TaxID=2714940 RepID=UPI00140DE9C8|nr:JAB domain-containing protein [Pedobacter sp. HDW13]QIL38088.1 JAB domain-containing protein [Pedobacter sp. HDW13]